MAYNNKLSFEVISIPSCKLVGLLDTSEYLNPKTVEGRVLQVVVPGNTAIVELNYYVEGVTILNSNNLGITNVDNPEYYTDLPDGIWVAKISICPYDQFWAEKKWFRTCQLECKFDKAFLTLELDKCTNCYSKDRARQLDLAWRYIQGTKANVGDCNFAKATTLYTVANNILDDLLECTDC